MASADLLNTREVAELYRTTPGALYTQRHRGQLPGGFGVFVGRRLLFRRSDLDGWLDSLIDTQLETVTDRSP